MYKQARAALYLSGSEIAVGVPHLQPFPQQQVLSEFVNLSRWNQNSVRTKGWAESVDPWEGEDQQAFVGCDACRTGKADRWIYDQGRARLDGDACCGNAVHFSRC